MYNCRLNKNVCNSKQQWNHDYCRYECEELVDWGYCVDDYVWNLSNSVCKWDKVCKIGKNVLQKTSLW